MIYLDVTSSCKSRLNTGVQRVVRGIARVLPEQGREVTPLLWSNSHRSYCQLAPREKSNLAWLPGPRFQHKNPGQPSNHPLAKTFRWLSESFRKLAVPGNLKSSDILLVPEIFQDARADFYRQARFPAGVGRAAIFYDALGWSLKGYDTANDHSRLEDYLRALAGFDLIFPISLESEKDLRNYWQSTGIPPTRTRTIPLPMPLTGARPELSENFSVRRILSVASLEDRKNHLLLLESCRNLWDQNLAFELVLVGRSIPGKSDAILARIAALQKEGRALSWIQHIDDQSLAETYAQCSFTVFPSVREGFGLPILESLWHGRPCVCGENGALGEAARGGGCHFVQQTDPTDLARGLRDLLERPDLYQQLFQEASARRFRSWNDYVSDLNKGLASLGNNLP